MPADIRHLNSEGFLPSIADLILMFFNEGLCQPNLSDDHP